MKRIFRNQEGFTFLEMSIVVAIIGILMLIAMPNYQGAAEKAQAKSCEANRKMIETQVVSYLIEKGTYPSEDSLDTPNENETFKELINASFLRQKPECPSGGTYTVAIPKDSTETLSVTCNEHDQ